MNAPAQRPRCAVRGLVAPRALCGAVIVGGEFCGSDKACEHKVLPKPAPVRQTQAEANAFWADKDYKKWVVEFKAGTLRKPKRWQVNVGAENTNGARRAGLAAADLFGHTWCRSAASTVRLATAQDLGCVATPGMEGGAA